MRSGVLSPAGGRALTGPWLSGGRWSLSRRRANCVAPTSRAAVMIAARTVNPSANPREGRRWSENDDHNYGLADFGHGASGSLFFLAGSARCPHRGGMDVHVERLDKTPQFPGHDRELCRVGHFVSVHHDAVRIGSRVCWEAVPAAWFAYTDLRADARRRHAVAAIRAKWGFVDSLETLLGFEEVA